jgi:hypothetical protein
MKENNHESITNNDLMVNFISDFLAFGHIGDNTVAGGMAAVNPFSGCHNCHGCLLVIGQEHPFSPGTRVGLPVGFVINVYGVSAYTR